MDQTVQSVLTRRISAPGPLRFRAAEGCGDKPGDSALRRAGHQAHNLFASSCFSAGGRRLPPRITESIGGGPTRLFSVSLECHFTTVNLPSAKIVPRLV